MVIRRLIELREPGRLLVRYVVDGWERPPVVRALFVDPDLTVAEVDLLREMVTVFLSGGGLHALARWPTRLGLGYRWLPGRIA
jgi:hypothetical protein